MATGNLIPTELSFVGIAKETVPNTPVAPSNYLRPTGLTPQIVIPPLADNSITGDMGKTANIVQGPTQQTFQIDGPVFCDEIGWSLAALLGDLTVTGAGDPFTTTFSLLNTSPGQPKTYTITDYNGSQARAYANSVCSELTVNFTSDGLVTYTSMWQGIGFATATKPTQSYTTTVVQPAWAATVSLNAIVGVLVTDFSITIKRTVTPVPALGGQSVDAQFAGGDLEATGSLTAVYDSTNGETVIGLYTGSAGASTQVPLSIDLSPAGSPARELKFQMTTAVLDNVTNTRETASYNKLACTFQGVKNATDVGTSAGKAPVKVTTKAGLASGTYA